jgi:hypothetical protein
MFFLLLFASLGLVNFSLFSTISNHRQSSTALHRVFQTLKLNIERGGHVYGSVDLQSLRYTGKLYLTEKLYGREEEMAVLLDEADSVISKQKKKSIVFISGTSGVGKTGLVMEVRQKS